MARWTFINAIGGLIISAATLVAATYLVYSLWKQGRGKLRVRLLLGMVVSDIALGIVAIVQEAFYLSGHTLETGSRGCDAGGFLITTVLWSQHMWTLAIALATFLLLKHPLSRWTYMMEKYSWASGPVIWICSIVHAIIWHFAVGWQSSGSLCYYGSAPLKSGLDGSLLIQFIPRALVFFFIMVLYSTLFNFLRRPDTIQLSSQFVSGGNSSYDKGNMGRVLRRFGGGGPPPKVNKPVDPDAPWEQLEFIQVGNKTWELSPIPTQQTTVYHPQAETSRGILVTSGTTSISSPRHSVVSSPILEVPNPLLHRSSSEQSPSTALSSQRPSEADTLVAPELRYDNGDLKDRLPRPLSPVNSTFEPDSSKSEMVVEEGSPVMSSSDNALRDFFQENQAVGLEEGTGTVNGEGTNKGGVQMSATAYFNRQASLLMLYFPLAYMVVFSMSLVRLIYGMVHHQTNPVLSLLSSWLVLSVGLIDGLVYGLAEFLVRRRVRRKMPDRM